MNNEVETIKKQFKETMDGKGEWAPLYTKLMQTVYSQPVLFVALSRENYDPASKTSIPLISTKDFGGKPAIYVFSDIGLAEIWMKAYKHVSSDGTVGLIAAAHKEPYDFLSLFQIAWRLGADRIMLDEGGDWVGIPLEDFFRANGMNPNTVKMVLSEEEMEEVNKNNAQIKLRFTKMDALPLK